MARSLAIILITRDSDFVFELRNISSAGSAEGLQISEFFVSLGKVRDSKIFEIFDAIQVSEIFGDMNRNWLDEDSLKII